MIYIKFFADWIDDKNLLKTVLCEYDWDKDNNYGNRYKFTVDNNYTHAILFNTVTPKLEIPKENVISLAQEPKLHLKLNCKYQEYCRKHVKKCYIGKNSYNLEEFIERYSYQFPHIKEKYVSNNLECKNKLINFVYSHKTWNLEGSLYKYRHILGNKILLNKLPVDIYGTATNKLKKKYGKKKNIKYDFHWKDIHKIYKNYKFTIVIENTQEPEYFSEKILIPLLCGSIPIYLGCLNIDNYFKDYIIHLTGNIDQDINVIRNICDNPDKFYRTIDVKQIQKIIHLKNVIENEFFK